MHDWTIRQGDALDLLQALPDGSVDAIVTSPPYADQRRYNDDEHPRSTAVGRRGNNNGRARRRAGVADYPAWIAPYLEQMFGVLAPRGSLMLNLGVVIRDGEESDYADRVLAQARDHGWRLLHRIAWTKPNAPPLSAQRYLTPSFEHVFWLAPRVDAYRGYDDSEPLYDKHTRKPHEPISVARHRYGFTERKGDERYVKRGKTHPIHPDGARPTTVIEAAVGRDRGVEHPAIMAREVAERLVRMSCPPSGLVLDPFCGAGTTGLCALRAGRRFLGFEIDAGYVELARRRIRDDAPLLNAGSEVEA